MAITLFGILKGATNKTQHELECVLVNCNKNNTIKTFNRLQNSLDFNQTFYFINYVLLDPDIKINSNYEDYYVDKIKGEINPFTFGDVTISVIFLLA